jgi:hypothetical protein
MSHSHDVAVGVNSSIAVYQQFSPEEDQRLLSLIEMLGTKRWSLLAHHMQTRTAKQCRERWHYYLNPELNKGPWTAQEDRILAEKHRELGNRWTEIAKFLPGRTNCLAKNRWNVILRAQQSKIAPPVKQPLMWPSEMDFKTLPPLIIRGKMTSQPNPIRLCKHYAKPQNRLNFSATLRPFCAADRKTPKRIACFDGSIKGTSTWNWTKITSC